MNDIYLEPVEKLNENQVNKLVSILNHDKKLLITLGNRIEFISNQKFVSYNKKWSEETNSKIYSIMLSKDNDAIGLISLSHINSESRTAKIGYWLESKSWNKGYATLAFKEMLKITKENNIKFVSCSISEENQASRAIWKTFNAKFKKRENKIIPLIEL